MTDGGRLNGVKVLVTRPRERSEELCFLLEDEGAEVQTLPLLELLPPEDPRPLGAAAEQIHRYAWVVLASPSAAQALVEACRQAGTLEALRALQVAVVGPGTASTSRGYGLTVTLESEVKSGEGLAEALRPWVSSGAEVLLPAAQEARAELFEGLVSAGARVTRVAAYRSAPVEWDATAVRSLEDAPPDVVVLGSPRTVEALADALEGAAQRVLARARLVVVGPTTAQAVLEQGWVSAGVAEQPTAAGLVEAAVRAVRG